MRYCFFKLGSPKLVNVTNRLLPNSLEKDTVIVSNASVIAKTVTLLSIFLLVIKDNSLLTWRNTNEILFRSFKNEANTN